MWAAKHCSILLSSGLGVFCHVECRLSLQQLWYYFFLTHPVNFPCGRKLEHLEKTQYFRQSVDWLFTQVPSENQTSFLWRPHQIMGFMVVSSPCRFVPFTFHPQHGRHPKIGRTNSGGILHHSARDRLRLRKQKTLKILGFVLYVEDSHKLIKTQFSIQSPSNLVRPTDVRVDTNIAILSSLMSVIGPVFLRLSSN
jgi:hypothetical protein